MPLLLMLPPQEAKTRDWAARVKAAVPALEVVVAEDAATARAAIGRADCAFGTLPADLLAHATRLRWRQAPQAAPPAGYYYPALVQHAVVVTNFREIYNDHIGAHIMAFVLAFARDFQRYLPQQARREWKPAALDTTVLGVDARRREVPPGVAELHGPDALDALLPRADFVILTVPHTPATEGFMNRARFQKMKRTAFFINIGRGKTTRLDDLVAAIRAGEIAGAGLDVFEQEPLPAEHPLWTTPGVLITPHTAGHGPYLDERRFEILLDNCRRFVAGQPLRNVVDKSSWF